MCNAAILYTGTNFSDFVENSICELFFFLICHEHTLVSEQMDRLHDSFT